MFDRFVAGFKKLPILGRLVVSGCVVFTCICICPFLFISAGIGSGSTPTPTSSEPPTSTEMPTFTATPTLQLKATWTATLTKTRTPIPTKTPIPPTATAIFYPTATPALNTGGGGGAGGNCDPSYPDVCLQMGIGDYDCAGGSGNGPNYVEGPIRVVGSDPFGLDGNGDGWGCE